MELRIDQNKIILSSRSKTLKTDRLMKDARFALGIDRFLSKAAEGIVSVFDRIRFDNLQSDDCFFLSTQDGKHTFFFRFGCQLAEKELNDRDIVFYRYVTTIQKKKAFHAFETYLSGPALTLTMNRSRERIRTEEYAKLYHVFSTQNAAFPFLNEQQRQIVTLEDRNVLVHGIAGSGKTNVCIDRILYCACREYAGKTLYTTFSRGLLSDTEYKIASFKSYASELIRTLKSGGVVFADEDYKSAIENKLGIWLDVDGLEKITDKLERIVSYLEYKVDYALIEDLYKKATDRQPAVAGESVFVREYIGNLKNYRLSANLKRIANLSYEIVYKEIYGMIFGCCDGDFSQPRLSKDDYISRRKDSFLREECETIYAIALDYEQFMKARGYVDSNSMSRELLRSQRREKYSLAVVDEVQDLTQVTLLLIRSLALKLFCVGDALQMINPTYFSFAYLKRLMFEQDVTSVAELKHNYRNSRLIEAMLEKLSQMNARYFGTHSFVLKSSGAENAVESAAICVKDKEFVSMLAERKFDRLTLIVDSLRKKEELRKRFPKQEILTVSEIKGLERQAVVLVDVLSDNEAKWAEMSRRTIDRKTADENSVYRYYFNLMYVALSRATQYVYVYESKRIGQFESFFAEQFQTLSSKAAIRKLTDTLGSSGLAEEETLARIDEFIKQEQFDNAHFAAQRLEDADHARLQQDRITVYADLSRSGAYRQAGIAFWKLGLIEDAKKQFAIAGDAALIDLLDACEGQGADRLDYGIVRFYPDVFDQQTATELILGALGDDLRTLRLQQDQLNVTIRRLNDGR